MIDRVRELLGYSVRRRRVETFGMFGCENLGDEAMLTAAKAVFAPVRVVGTVRRTKHSLLNAILDSQTPEVLVIGGGTLIHGGENGHNGWLDFVEAQMEKGAAIATIGTGVSLTETQIKERSPIVDRWVRVLERARMIGVRGPLSEDILLRLGINSTIVGDLAFSLLETRQREIHSGAIGINVGECLGDQAAFEQEMIRLVKMLGRNHRLNFYVVTPLDVESTRRVIETSGISNFKIWTIFESAAAFIATVRSNRMFIGVKLHASGLALCAGVPSLLFEYKPKCRDFMAAIGNEQALLKLPVHSEENDAKIAKLMDVDDGPPENVTENIRKCAALQRQWAGCIASLGGS